MRLLTTALVASLMACAASLPVPRQEQLVTRVEPQGPVPSLETTAVRGLPPKVKQVFVKQLEADMERAARVGAEAQAIRLEQKFEDEILTRTVKKLSSHRGDRAKQTEDLRELQDMMRRDKRAVEVLSSLLSSSSGGGSGGDDTSGSGGGGGGSNVVSLIGSLVGGSSNGGGGDGEGGGGSNILSLLGPLSGSLSGGISGGGGDSQDGGGGSNILSLVSGLLGSSSGSSSGGDSQDGGGGGGSNVLSLVSGLLGSSSGGAGNAAGGGGGGTGGSKDPLQGGTYDDLIGKGPFSSVTNGLSRLLMFKFTIFRTVFSLLTSILTSSSSTGS
ncbi:keratin, type I cytoskeletal 9-like isoform X3 [Zootermopsis nevadensis]|uniref:keratin, type I cytoskeletal 9-like isoform X3 n=1 Tax=Zootermopsis nevadensis TaxID=136037 RepID=UPI000B8E6F05|nr:keratin, type I cytoskeletal 9-like isoform X3 [Zootermopsis nevadensis]